jgi:hypothetical protein
MKLGDLVIVIEPSSCFEGQRGRVIWLRPIMVLLDGEERPMRFGEGELQCLPN